jgi:hypothetical protein
MDAQRPVVSRSDDLPRIRDTLAKIQVQGDRYPAHLAASVGR